jgi:hypothetical protein
MRALFQVTFCASVRSKRRMSAIVALSPDGSFGDELVKDRGAVAFYAVSKNDFCPVLSCRS